MVSNREWNPFEFLAKVSYSTAVLKNVSKKLHTHRELSGYSCKAEENLSQATTNENGDLKVYVLDIFEIDY